MVRPVLVGAALRSVGTVVLSGIVQLRSMIVLMLQASFNILNSTFESLFSLKSSFKLDVSKTAHYILPTAH